MASLTWYLPYHQARLSALHSIAYIWSNKDDFGYASEPNASTRSRDMRNESLDQFPRPERIQHQHHQPPPESAPTLPASPNHTPHHNHLPYPHRLATRGLLHHAHPHHTHVLPSSWPHCLPGAFNGNHAFNSTNVSFPGSLIRSDLLTTTNIPVLYSPSSTCTPVALVASSSTVKLSQKPSSLGRQLRGAKVTAVLQNIRRGGDKPCRRRRSERRLGRETNEPGASVNCDQSWTSWSLGSGCRIHSHTWFRSSCSHQSVKRTSRRWRGLFSTLPPLEGPGNNDYDHQHAY